MQEKIMNIIETTIMDILRKIENPLARILLV